MKLDEDGYPIKSHFQSKKNDKESAWQTVEGTQETVKRDRVEKWSTKQEVLSKLESTSRAANMAIKSFINSNNVGVWFHNANTDDCAMFGGPHWHIMLASKMGANGTYQYIHDCNKMRMMRTKCTAAGGYVYAMKAISPLYLTRHLNCKPRIYVGSNHPKINALYLKACEEGELIDAKMDDFVEKEDDDNEEEIKKNRGEKRYNSWEDYDERIGDNKRNKINKCIVTGKQIGRAHV